MEIIFKSFGSLRKEILNPFCDYFNLSNLQTTEIPQRFIRNSQTQKKEGPNKNKRTKPDALGAEVWSFDFLILKKGHTLVAEKW